MFSNLTQVVPKELIGTLSFPSFDVLHNPEAIRKREFALKRVTALGNVFHQKVRIIFEDSTNKNVVETTVWDCSEKELILKYGVKIPVHRIHEIQFYF